ncbi:MAG: hypothetical protein GOVbin630_147 [Prokaryotic dsDNA virus sp.]|nr:MAG: hypothetical protein GOVbin630_147 [Prokaryotic dsDNA virus sp.]|tara:strand:- start:10040 stop:10414 length:375 start_codon:yes stop_codon:yes gene_type:complete
MKLLFEAWNNYINETTETYVVERSGVGWDEKFVIGGTPDNPIFGPLEKAYEFASEESATSYARNSDIYLSVANKTDYEIQEKEEEEEYTKLPSLARKDRRYGHSISADQQIHRMRQKLKKDKKK